MFYALENKKEFFEEKVSIFVALSPTTQLTNTQSDMIKFTSQKMQLITEAEALFDIREVFGPTW